MKNNSTDPNKPFGRLARVADFLPPPEKLVSTEENVKVTISISKPKLSSSNNKPPNAPQNTKNNPRL